MRRLLVLLLCCTGVTSALSDPQVVSVRSGSTQTVMIHLAFRDWLLSRETPNEIRLQTPWGTLQTIPQGRPHDQRSTYFGLLYPAALRLYVPGQVAAARYPARLEATLYVCQKQQQLCSRRQLVLPVVL
ncbi:hypothetical protein [Deinococcus deserti]|uniref:Thiol:disulfide interchange protein DsbD N-terminal domain-containing protein n=1 Tax=Deinococcus deserti (strain DSM 17065 / CIP 109153 / LMG 22923 / VCD115) TaxID=546414 RepID=C1CZ78_DEIDV|nr:hypothetical protein [Deinococcus deserti]ACO45116.2 hypothetical protein Deide_02971 [Deinococcus deserti VCD115]